MTWAFASPDNSVKPGHAVPVGDRYARFYYDNEAVVISWTDGAEAAVWRLRDYYGAVVSSGTVSGTSVNLGVLPLGWYKLYLSTGVANDATPFWGEARGEFLFVVARGSGPLRNTPIVETQFGMGNSAHATHVLTGMGQSRMSVYLDSSGGPATFAASLTTAKNEVTFQNSYMLNDAARTRPMLCHFPNGTGGTAPTPTDTAQITQAVNELYAMGVTHFEARNEPNTGSYTAANYVTELQAFYNAVKAAQPNAKVLGGCSVNMTSAYIDQILAAGAGQYMDEMSVHAYNSTNGNLGAGRKTYEFFAATLAKNNFTKPVYMSEYGQFGAVYGSFEPRLQVQWAMMDMHLAEQHGIPHEKYMWFYDRGNGFWDYPSFIWVSDYNYHHPFPIAAAMRVWTEETWGKTFKSRLDFGVEDAQWLGSRFAGADGSAVLCLQSGGGTGAVSFDVTGASSLTLVDTWGATSTVAVVGGKVSLTLDVEPTYLRLPSGATATPTPVTYGLEVARAQYAIASASSIDTAGNVGPPSVALDGAVDNGAYTSLGAKVFRTDRAQAGPWWWRMDLPTTTRFDRVVVYCPHPWQRDSTLVDFDLQVLDANGSTWSTVATYTSTNGADTSFRWVSHISAGNCFTDSYWHRRHIFTFVLPTVAETKGLRIFARDTSNGGGAVAEINTGFGSLDSAGAAVSNGQTGPKCISLMEVTCHLSPGRDGGTAVVGEPMLPVR